MQVIGHRPIYSMQSATDPWATWVNRVPQLDFILGLKFHTCFTHIEKKMLVIGHRPKSSIKSVTDLGVVRVIWVPPFDLI